MNENKNLDNINNENSVENGDNLADLTKNKSVGTNNLIAVLFVVVVAIAFGIYLLFSLLTNKENVETFNNEIGTKVDNRNLEFTEILKIKTPPIVEEKPVIIEETAVETNPFTPQNTINKFEVLKSGSSAMIATSGSSNGGSIGDDGIREITAPNGDIVRIDRDGNIIERESAGGNIYGENDSAIRGQVFSPQVAKVSKYNPNLLLSKGTYIGCSLNTKVVSTIAGGISCTVSQNVYSTNGNVLLIERGSIVTGYFNSGQLKNGMNRIFVTWQEIKTPKNIIIPVYSGASDELGGSGLVGEVDNHYLQRFSAAILLSVIDDAFNVLLNGGTGTRNNKNDDYTENTRETTQQMASIALEHFINIEPTLYKNQGDLVGIYVNRDIDFSKVYNLKRIKK